jgi:hypothetical protein
MKSHRSTALTLAAVVCFASAPARATIYDFSIDLSNGPNTGTLNGTVDLSFVSGGGSGSGSASSLTLTSIPASFGGLGDTDVTSWADQFANSFTVTAGAVTSFAFFAATGLDDSVDDAFIINSTGSSLGDFGDWYGDADLNELSKTENTFGYNFGGASGVSFSIGSGVPESSTWTAFIVGFAGLGLVGYRRSPTRRAVS